MRDQGMNVWLLGILSGTTEDPSTPRARCTWPFAVAINIKREHCPLRPSFQAANKKGTPQLVQLPCQECFSGTVLLSRNEFNQGEISLQPAFNWQWLSVGLAVARFPTVATGIIQILLQLRLNFFPYIRANRHSCAWPVTGGAHGRDAPTPSPSTTSASWKCLSY